MTTPSRKHPHRAIAAVALNTFAGLVSAAALLLAGCTSASDRAIELALDTCASPTSKSVDAEIACTAVIDGIDSTERQRVAALYNRGVLKGNSGSLDDAMADLDRVLALDPGRAIAFNGRAVLYSKKGDMEAARRDFEAAIRLKPTDASFHADFGIAYQLNALPEPALPHLNRALELDPKATTARATRCWVMGVLNRELEQALADCDRALKEDPQNYNTYSSRGLVHYRLGHYEASVADVNRFIAGKPNSAFSHYLRGLAGHALGRHAEAEADIAKSLQMNPNAIQRYQGFGLKLP